MLRKYRRLPFCSVRAKRTPKLPYFVFHINCRLFDFPFLLARRKQKEYTAAAEGILEARNIQLQGSARTGEKYGDKWSMTESKIDGSRRRAAGTVGRRFGRTCVDPEIVGIRYL